MLLNRKPTLEEFLTRPLIYSSLFDYKIDQLIPETFIITTEKGKSVSFQFKTNTGKRVDKIEIQALVSGDVLATYPLLHQSTNGVSQFEQTFNSKGTHIIHFLLNDSYVFSYCVNVK